MRVMRLRGLMAAICGGLLCWRDGGGGGGGVGRERGGARGGARSVGMWWGCGASGECSQRGGGCASGLWLVWGE